MGRYFLTDCGPSCEPFALAVRRNDADFRHIFAGSVRNKMDYIFTDHDSPFFKSAASVQVGTLDKKIFRQFISGKFSQGKRTITKDAMQRVFRICSNVPGDVQQLCEALWDTTSYGGKISKTNLPAALKWIFGQEYKGYETALKIMSSQQFKLLIALAKIGGKAPTSTAFLKQSGIAQASSIRAAMKRLMDLKLIFFYEKEYRFVNPFFKAWLLFRGL